MFFSNLIFILLISFLNYDAISGSELSCKDDRSIPVDYWVLYSPPQSSSKGYLYYVKGQSENNWRTSAKGIFERDSMIGRTFNHVYGLFKGYKDLPQYNYFQYNSQAKDLDSFGRSVDAKGIIVWNKVQQRAIWLLHSIPYTDEEGHIFMPSFKSDNKYDYHSIDGHMALCINLNYNYLKSILRNLLAINVNVYDRNIDPIDFQSLARITPFETRTDLRTAASHEFTIHTKLQDNVEHMWGTKWLQNYDLKSQYLVKKQKRADKAKKQESPNISESSNRQKFCGKKNIANILGLKATLNGRNINWKYGNDKSKWSIDVTNNKFCFSDFNRDDFNAVKFMGNVLCLNDPKLHSLLNSLIEIKSCKRRLK